MVLGLVLLTGCGGSDAEDAAASPNASALPSPAAFPSPSPTVEPSPSASPSPPSPIALGSSQAGDLGDITVYTVNNPVKPQDSSADRIATDGTEFAVADIKLCATATTEEYSPSDWQVKDAEDRAYPFWNVQIGAKDPNLTDTMRNIAAGDCTRGFLTFEVLDGTTLTEIVYAPFDGAPLSWPL